MLKVCLVLLVKSWQKQLSLMLCFVIISSATLYAQTAAGKLTGKITDASTNEPLTGVSILIKGTKKGGSSITDGTYILTLSPGTYSLQYSSSGYQTKEITGVAIKAGQTSFLDIILQAGSQKLESVVVTSTVKKEAQSSLYSAQKRSAAASDGISQEAIRKTPDNNAGQILKRVVGINVQNNRFVVVRGLNDQYNQTMLNGVPMTSTETNRNAFAFDLIPAAVIDNITVNKTATPDMPGNFAGGIVQVNTKDFPAKDFYSITLQTSLSDGTYGKDFYSDKRSQFEVLSFDGKFRDLPKNFPASTTEVPIYYLNSQEQIRNLRSLKNTLAPINYGPSGLNENVQVGYGKTITLKNKSQFGIITAINQRKTEFIEEEISAREPIYTDLLLPDTLQGLGYYSENKRYNYSVDFGGVVNLAYRFGNNKITLKNLYTRVFNNTFIDRPILNIDIENFNRGSNSPLVGYSYLTERRSILNNILAGEHRTGRNNETRLEWNINATQNKTNTPDTRNFLFTVEDSTKNILSGNNNANFEQSLVGFSRLWSFTNDIIYGGAFNITTPFTFWGNKHLLKSGILFQNRVRKAVGTVLPIGGLHGTIDEVLDPGAYYPGGANIIGSSSAIAGGSGNYNAGSNLLAMYESIENRIFNKLRIIWGIRIENYQQNITVYTPVFLRDFQDPLQKTLQFGARTTFNFLPSVNLVYSPSTAINIRAAYSNTVIRPELKDIAAFARYDFQTFSLTQGNPLLKSASINNYDFKFEWFPSSGEIISFSAFYKKLKDPIEYARGNNGLEVFKFRIPLNSGDTYVKGIEAELRKKIDFVSFMPWLKHLTVFGNASLLESKSKRKEINNNFFISIDEHALTGQPNYIFNFGLSISALDNSFELTASYNKTGDYINELGSSNSDRQVADGVFVPRIPHFRVKARDMVDLVMTQSLWKDKCRLKLNVINVLKQRYILYQDLNGNKKFDTPVSININKVALNYMSGIDNTASSIVPQRGYSFAITYTF